MGHMNAPDDPPGQSPERRRLTQLIEQRAGELGLDWNGVAELADLTKEGLRGVRFGNGRMRIKTKGGIERALRWSTGSVNAILAGGDPTVADRSTGARGNEAEEEDQFAKMDRLYEEWKRDPERRQALWTILRSGEEKDAG